MSTTFKCYTTLIYCRDLVDINEIQELTPGDVKLVFMNS